MPHIHGAKRLKEPRPAPSPTGYRAELHAWQQNGFFPNISSTLTKIKTELLTKCVD